MQEVIVSSGACCDKKLTLSSIDLSSDDIQKSFEDNLFMFQQNNSQICYNCAPSPRKVHFVYYCNAWFGD